MGVMTKGQASLPVLTDLARARLAAGVELYVERGQETAAAAGSVRWTRLWLGRSKIDPNVPGWRSRPPGLPILQLADGSGSGPSWQLLTPAQTAMVTDMIAVTSMDFARLIAALNSPMLPSASCGASCFWYAGALVYARSGMVQALSSLEAAHPELAALQRQGEMAACLADRQCPVPPAAGLSRRARVI